MAKMSAQTIDFLGEIVKGEFGEFLSPPTGVVAAASPARFAATYHPLGVGLGVDILSNLKRGQRLGIGKGQRLDAAGFVMRSGYKTHYNQTGGERRHPEQGQRSDEGSGEGEGARHAARSRPSRRA